MAVAPKFDDGLYDHESPQSPPPQSNTWKSCLIGCLVVAGVVALLLVIVSIWVYYNIRAMSADIISDAANQIVDQSQLSPQEKVAVKAQLDRVVVAFRENKMSVEQFQTLVKKIQDSPLLTSFVVWVVDAEYFEKSGLSQDEKSEGRQTLRRFTRGMIVGMISKQTAEKVMAPISQPGRDGKPQPKETVTDEELRTFLASAKAEADKVNIPEQPADINISEEVKRIVDETLGPGPGAALEPPPLELPPAQE